MLEDSIPALHWKHVVNVGVGDFCYG